MKKNIVNEKKQKTFSVGYKTTTRTTTTTTTSKIGGKAVRLAEKSVHKNKSPQKTEDLA